MSSEKSDDDEHDTISKQIVDYYRKYSRTRHLPKYFSGTPLSYMPTIVPEADIAPIETPTIVVDTSSETLVDKQPEDPKPVSPTSSVTSNRKLEWDNGADIGYQNCSKTSRLQKSTSLPILLTDQNVEDKGGFKLSTQIVTVISYPSSDDIHKGSYHAQVPGDSSSSSVKTKSKDPSTSSSSSFPPKTVSTSTSSLNTIAYLKSRIGEPDAESTPKITSTDFKTREKFKKHVTLCITKPITINCVATKKGLDKLVQTSLLLENVSKSVQTSLEVLPEKSPELPKAENQSVIFISYSESEKQIYSSASPCDSFEYYKNEKGFKKTSTDSSNDLPILGELISQKQSKSVIGDVNRSIELLQKLLKSKKYDPATKKRYIKKIVEKIVDSKYNEDSTTSSELFVPKPQSRDHIWQPKLTVKTFSDEFLPQKQKSMFVVSDGSRESSLEKQSSYQSWKEEKTKSERILEEKQKGQGDHVVTFAKKERQHQLEWINDEISHLTKLKGLLEQKVQRTTTVYMVKPEYSCTCSSGTSSRNYVIETELSKSSSSSVPTDYNLLDKDGKRKYQVRGPEDHPNRNVIGEVEVVSDEGTTNIKIKTVRKDREFKPPVLVGGGKYEGLPKSKTETSCTCKPKKQNKDALSDPKKVTVEIPISTEDFSNNLRDKYQFSLKGPSCECKKSVPDAKLNVLTVVDPEQVCYCCGSKKVSKDVSCNCFASTAKNLTSADTQTSTNKFNGKVQTCTCRSKSSGIDSARIRGVSRKYKSSEKGTKFGDKKKSSKKRESVDRDSVKDVLPATSYGVGKKDILDDGRTIESKSTNKKYISADKDVKSYGQSDTKSTDKRYISGDKNVKTYDEEKISTESKTTDKRYISADKNLKSYDDDRISTGSKSTDKRYISSDKNVKSDDDKPISTRFKTTDRNIESYDDDKPVFTGFKSTDNNVRSFDDDKISTGSKSTDRRHISADRNVRSYGDDKPISTGFKSCDRNIKTCEDDKISTGSKSTDKRYISADRNVKSYDDDKISTGSKSTDRKYMTADRNVKSYDDDRPISTGFKSADRNIKSYEVDKPISTGFKSADKRYMSADRNVKSYDDDKSFTGSKSTERKYMTADMNVKSYDDDRPISTGFKSADKRYMSADRNVKSYDDDKISTGSKTTDKRYIPTDENVKSYGDDETKCTGSKSADQRYISADKNVKTYDDKTKSSDQRYISADKTVKSYDDTTKPTATKSADQKYISTDRIIRSYDDDKTTSEFSEENYKPHDTKTTDFESSDTNSKPFYDDAETTDFESIDQKSEPVITGDPADISKPSELNRGFVPNSKVHKKHCRFYSTDLDDGHRLGRSHEKYKLFDTPFVRLEKNYKFDDDYDESEIVEGNRKLDDVCEISDEKRYFGDGEDQKSKPKDYRFDYGTYVQPGDLQYSSKPDDNQYRSRPDDNQYRSQPDDNQYRSKPDENQYHYQPDDNQYRSKPDDSQYRSQPGDNQYISKPDSHYDPADAQSQPTTKPETQRNPSVGIQTNLRDSEVEESDKQFASTEVQTCQCTCNIKQFASTKAQTATTESRTTTATGTSSTSTTTSESLRSCVCCKRQSAASERLYHLRQKLSDQTYPLCRPCYRQNRIACSADFYNPRHVCHCYSIVQTTTLNEIKRTINDLNDLDEFCTCTKSGSRNTSKYCKYCQCKLKKTSRNRNSIAYMLTFENEPVQEAPKKKHKKRSLEEIRIKIPVVTKKRHKDKENKKKKERRESEDNGAEIRMRGGESSTSDSPKDGVATLQEYLRQNRPEFVEDAEGRRKTVNQHRTQREEMADYNKLEFLKRCEEERENNRRRLFSGKEMKEITKRNYNKLPEVQQRLQNNREKQLRQASRLMADTFNRKLRENVLKGKRNLPTNCNVICM